MAWNEPGGTGNKDPWGSRKNNDQGPPDLDEMLRKLQNMFRSLLGRKRSTGGDSGRAARPILGVVALLGLVVWCLSGIYIVDPAERGVVQRFGAYVSTSLPGPHWHLPYPIETATIVNVDQIRNRDIGFRSDGLKQTVEPVPREALMLTKDENIIDIRFSIQYRVKDAAEYLFDVYDPDFTLTQVTEGAVRQIIGRSAVDFVLTEGRNQIEDQSRELIQKILDRYKCGLLVTSVNMQGAQPPEEVQDAFQDVNRAISDQQRLINEAETYANGIIPTARGDAARRIAEANAYKAKVVAQADGDASRFTQVLEQYRKAPEVTRERLYIDSMEAVLSSSSKVLMDVKGNNMVYLPLDRLFGQERTDHPPAPVQPPVLSDDTDKTATVTAAGKDSLRDRDRSRGER